MKCIMQFSFNYIYMYKTLLILSFLLYMVKISLCKCTLAETASDPEKKKREEKLLNKIKPLQGLEFTDSDEDGGTKYNYTVRICETVKGEKGNVGAMQYSETQNYTLGLYNQSDIMGGTDWLMLTYYNGSSHHDHCNASERITRIMIICDPVNFKGEFRILEEKLRSNSKYCFYLFELSSSVACTMRPIPQPLPQGLSSGAVFCILFFTFVGIYLILGFCYQRLVAGAKGLEQIPNYSFWRSFGNLQADGCDYVCRCGPRHESQAYRGIDDRFKTEDERDDQLLNM